MKNPKITIITVSYNSERTIKTTLDSVKYQKYKNIEHLIIDGNSNDKTLAIVKEYPHIKKIISEPDKGIYDAMNKGIKISTGDIIGFLNSDDFYTSNEVISKVANIFKNEPSLDSCYADLIYTKSLDTSKNTRYWKSSQFISGLFSKGWCPPHATFFVNNLIYKRYGVFNLTYTIASDVELMMRFLEVHKIKTRYIPEIWVKMRSGGTTNKNFTNILKQNIEILNALKNHKLSNNRFKFFVNKIISRSLQYIRR